MTLAFNVQVQEISTIKKIRNIVMMFAIMMLVSILIPLITNAMTVTVSVEAVQVHQIINVNLAELEIIKELSMALFVNVRMDILII